MFAMGLIAVFAVCGGVFLLGTLIGNKRLEQQEKELELIRLKNELEKQRLENELYHKKELQKIGEKLIKDEEYYMNGLKEEIERIEKNLNELELNQIPTREQLETWLFLLKSENMITNERANEIIKLYDVRRIYPESKV